METRISILKQFAWIASLILFLEWPGGLCEVFGHVPIPRDMEVVDLEESLKKALDEGLEAQAINLLKSCIEDKARGMEVRKRAIAILTDIGGVEIGTYFIQLADSSYSLYEDREIRYVLYLGYWKSAFNREDDDNNRVGLLLSILKGDSPDKKPRVVFDWAADQLCDLGVQDVIPIMESAFSEKMQTVERSDRLECCKMQVQLLNKNATRLKAFKEALALGSGVYGGRLYFWAIAGLDRLETMEADLILVEEAKGRLKAKGAADGLYTRIYKMLLENGWDEDMLVKYSLVRPFFMY